MPWRQDCHVGLAYTLVTARDMRPIIEAIKSVAHDSLQDDVEEPPPSPDP